MLVSDKKKKVFQEVYPFTTENIKGYFSRISFKDNNVFTVGSSLDQAFNALLLGAKKITVFDINANTEEFYKVKRDLILKTPRVDLYDVVLSQKNVEMI